MQVAQAPQERMEPGLQRRTGVAPAGLLLVAALQVRAGAERPARAGEHQASHLGFPLVDRIKRLGKTAEHIHRHRVHDLLVVELEDGDRSIELERGVLELHGFLFRCGPHGGCAAGWI